MTTTFDWVRHGESVANWANNKPSDSYTAPAAEFALKIEIQKFQALEYLNVKKMKESSSEFPLINHVYDIIEENYKNLKDDTDSVLKENCQIPDYGEIDNLSRLQIIEGESLEKIQQIWELGKIDVVNNGCIDQLRALRKPIEDNAENKEMQKTNTNYIKQKLIDMKIYPYWLRNMITTNFLFQPTLTYVGMDQASNLGKKMLEGDLGTYDLVISSPSVRTLMTGYIALMHCGDKSIVNKTITIVPYTNEKENDTELVLYEDGLHDFTNAALHPAAIDGVCKLIKGYLDAKYPEKDTQVNFDTEKYINYCEGKTEQQIDDIRRNDIKKFWNYVSGNGKKIFKEKKNVLSFCHGYAIDEVRKSAKVDVTLIFQKDCNSNDNNSFKFRSFGANTSIFRHKYENGKVLQNMSKDGEEFSQPVKKGGSSKQSGGAKDYKGITCKGDLNMVMKDPEVIASLSDIGYVYIPAKIRGNNFLDHDKVKIEDDLMGLHEGSLRYDIAKITHGPQWSTTSVKKPAAKEPAAKEPSAEESAADATSDIYCRNNGYYKEIKGVTRWKSLRELPTGIDRATLKNCTEYKSHVGGRRTRRRKGKKTKTRRRKAKKTRRGKKTKKHY